MKRNQKNIVIYLDNARGHKRNDVLSEFKRHWIKVHFLPARMTAFTQPADCSWFISLKSKYHRNWQEWLLNEPKSFTKSNNPKSPGYAKSINWISQIWHEFEIIS